VLYHAFPSLLPGGFVGVDVFFVISGYLIGGLIRDELVERRFSVARFYARRIRRLFPALLVVLAATLAGAWWLLLPDEYAQLGKHARAGLTFTLNFVLRREDGYFDVAAEAKPLLHLWSLAIEEQFYIVWPAIAWATFRWRRDPAKVVVALLAISFVWNAVRIMHNPVATFFLPQTRAWELLAGTLLVHVERADASAFALRLRGWIKAIPADARATLGLAFIGAALALLDPDARFPGWWALLPVLGTALVISAGPDAWINHALLAARGPVFVGLVSYPLYLWHWPLLSVARITEGQEPSALVRGGLVALAALLAVATWRFVERPIRAGILMRRPVTPILLGAALAVAIVAHLASLWIVTPYSSRFGVGPIMAAAGEWDYPGSDMREERFAGRSFWVKDGGLPGSALFLGDSTMEQYGPRIRALIDADPSAARTAVFVTGGGCMPIPNVERPNRPGCATLVAAARAYLAARDVRTVVVAASWWSHFKRPEFFVGGQPLPEPAARRRALDSLSDFLRELADGGRRVYLVLGMPVGPEFDPRLMVERGFGTFSVHADGLPRADVDGELGGIDDLLRATAQAAGATVIDPREHLCDASICPAVDAAGEPIYKDASHLRPRYVREHVTYLDATLRAD
jgi:peptidoglycan/LPS O-acetylase OafA/YrhL